MKGDFTRSTFDPKKHYHAVLQQQGRVQVDADWNEQARIDSYRTEAGVADVVGGSGGPLPTPGFEIKVTANKKDLRIGPGHYYVDGILCELDAETAPNAQEDLPANARIMVLSTGPAAYSTAPEDGVYLAYLDVWLHHLTALERPELRESALGGPDHATREKLMAHVKFLRVGPPGTNLNCLSDIPAFNALAAPNLGTLNARTRPGRTSDDPCIVNPGAGYRRLENQLYRVEIHKGGTFNGTDQVANPTFKWSRDNGSITAGWNALNGNDLTISLPGRDKVTGFASGQWIELTDDTRETAGEAGLLVQITSVKGNVLTINPGGQVFTYAQFPKNPKIRRWDSAGAARVIRNPDPQSDNYLALEGGVEVLFGPGEYRTGDWWLIPARTSGPTTIGDIEWPRDTSPQKNPIPQSPQGIRHRFARLGLVEFSNAEWKIIADCRGVFAPLTQQTALFMVGGDGQEAWAHANPAQDGLVKPLAAPLQVGVARGRFPVPGARVRFTATPAGGLINGVPGPQTVPTNPQGVASVTWQLDPDLNTPAQSLEARLLDAADNPVHLPVVFRASLSQAHQVAYDPTQTPNLAAAHTVQRAIELLSQMGGQGGVGCCKVVGPGGDFNTLKDALDAFLKLERPAWCLCLLPGAHVLEGYTLERPRARLALCGGGLQARLHLKGKGLQVRGFAALLLRDLQILVEDASPGLEVLQTNTLRMDGCEWEHRVTAGVPTTVVLKTLNHASLTGNSFRATFAPPTDSNHGLLVEGVRGNAEITAIASNLLLSHTVIDRTEASNTIAGLSLDRRTEMSRAFLGVMDANPNRFSVLEKQSIRELALAVATPQADEAAALADKARAVLESDSSSALATSLRLDDTTGDVVIQGNTFDGVISLLGDPMDKLPPAALLKQLEANLKKSPVFHSKAGGSLRLQDNRLPRITCSSEASTSLLLQDTGAFHRWAQILHNRFWRDASFLIADQVSLHGNAWEVRDPGIPFLAGHVISNLGVYVGNQTDLTDPAALRQPPTLRVIDYQHSEAASLLLNLV